MKLETFFSIQLYTTSDLLNQLFLNHNSFKIICFHHIPMHRLIFQRFSLFEKTYPVYHTLDKMGYFFLTNCHSMNKQKIQVDMAGI